MKKKKSRKKWIILGVVLVIVILIVVGFIRMRENLEALAKTTYDIVDVERGTIEVKVKGAGAAQPLVDQTVYAPFTGTVQDVRAEDGDVVAQGDVIAVFTSDALDTERDATQQQIDEVDAAIATMRSTSGSDVVRSPVEGTVKAIYADVGDMVDVVVDQYGALAVVCPDDVMQTAVPAGDVSPGDSVTVTVGETSVTGMVHDIDANTSLATVRFDDDDFDVNAEALVTGEDGVAMGAGVVDVANPVYITARGGVIDDVYEDAGDSVSRGGKLFGVDGEILSAELYAQIEAREGLMDDLADIDADIASLTVRAPSAGVVSGLELNPEQIVQEGTPLFTIESNDQIKIDVDIDELDIAGISVGQEAEVEFDALPEKTYTATVVKINPIGVAVNNVTNFTITLQIDSAPEILLGMSADVEIVSQRADNVLVIPQEAIQVIDGEKYVVFEEDVDEELLFTPATHKVVTGITDGVMIEVLSGLGEGDRVAVPQARQLTPQEMQQQMMMGRYGDDEE
jgi:HlyD family secretion protein